MSPTRRDALKALATLALASDACAKASTRTRTRPAVMNFRPLMELRLATSAVQTLGATPHGALSIFPIVGGTFEGERLRGRVLPGGADHVTRGTDGVLRLDLRVTLETDDGASIAMTFTGVRDDASHYFRTLPRFETAAPKYAFLNRLLAVGLGEIRDGQPVHVVEEIL